MKINLKKYKYKNKSYKPDSGNPFIIQEGKDKSDYLEDFSYRKAWTEDSFSPGSQKETVGRTFDFSKLKITVLIILFFLFIIVGRVAWLQIIKGDYYYSMAEGNRIRVERTEAKRGIIYDRNYNLLVRNVANFLLYFVPADLPKDEIARENLINKISDILENIDKDEIKRLLTTVKEGSLESFQPLFITDNIPYEKAIALYLESDFMPGVVLSNKSRREYSLYSLSLSHILGYTGKINEAELEKVGEDYLAIDYLGKTGIEYFWESELKGKNGKKQVEVDALGKEKKIISTLAAEAGHNLVLSLDINLQKKLEETIIYYLEKLNKNKAAAIILNPNNGEILAMVSFPSYNNNIFARGISQEEYNGIINHPDNPLFNRVISGEYPSGSTIKPVIAAAALEEGTISEWTTINSVGGITIGEWFFPDWRAGGHGIVDVRTAISQSVNTFFYYIGGGFEDFNGLGVDRIVNYAKLFGLG
ncbi:MAG: penicillin-binding transpeptidase domain-containing protein, partial [Patescibacteria group bacterium]